MEQDISFSKGTNVHLLHFLVLAIRSSRFATGMQAPDSSLSNRLSLLVFGVQD